MYRWLCIIYRLQLLNGINNDITTFWKQREGQLSSLKTLLWNWFKAPKETETYKLIDVSLTFLKTWQTALWMCVFQFFSFQPLPRGLSAEKWLRRHTTRHVSSRLYQKTKPHAQEIWSWMPNFQIKWSEILKPMRVQITFLFSRNANCPPERRGKEWFNLKDSTLVQTAPITTYWRVTKATDRPRGFLAFRIQVTAVGTWDFLRMRVAKTTYMHRA